MCLDRCRRTLKTYAFDDVRVERPLDEPIRGGAAMGDLLELTDEETSDNLSLSFGITDPGQPREKASRCGNYFQLHLEVLGKRFSNDVALSFS